jgi:hypothetical protein
MQREPIPRKSLAQDAENPLGIERILECHDGIVSEADKGTSKVRGREGMATTSISFSVRFKGFNSPSPARRWSKQVSRCCNAELLNCSDASM